MKATRLILTFAAAGLLFESCSKSRGDNPGVEYAPDMYVSKGYEAFTQVAGQKRMIISVEGDTVLISPDGKNMREPIKGTIARGKMGYIYPYPNTPEGYEQAKAELKSPLTDSLMKEQYLADGKYLFDINCAVCHGENGLGDGSIVRLKKFPPPPSYKGETIKNLPEGGMYHTITYGKNLMGSYASALSPEDRWKVIKYIQFLRDK